MRERICASFTASSNRNKPTLTTYHDLEGFSILIESSAYTGAEVSVPATTKDGVDPPGTNELN